MHTLYRGRRITFLALLVLICAGCAGLLTRSGDSGYSYRGDGDNEVGSSARYDRYASARNDASQELGIPDGRELTTAQRNAVENRMVLKQLEKNLQGKREREQYFRVKPIIENDRERIEFLRIGTYEGRTRWLNARGYDANNPRYNSEVQSLIEKNDIMMGMPKQAVKDSWGEPEVVEVAGNPLYGNERWKYIEQVSSPEGFQTEQRIVYFEAGRVVGWEKY